MKNLSRVVPTQLCAQMMVISLLIWVFRGCSNQSNEYVEPPPPKVTVAEAPATGGYRLLEVTVPPTPLKRSKVRPGWPGFCRV